jgi:DNA-binding transcriptional LysR family regulator
MSISWQEWETSFEILEGKMDRLASMSILVSAVEVGSLSAAARKLGMPLATVSRKVSELEAHLKTRLLNRSSRRLTLTDAGRSYVAACRRILEEVGEAERAAAGEYSAPKGDLGITAPIVFGQLHVLPIAMAFLKAYPDIDIRMVLADRVVNLLEDRVDLAVRIGALPDSSLIATRLGAIRRVVCASQNYFAERGMPKTPDDLAAHDCITFEGLMSPEVFIFDAGRSQASVAVHSRLIVNMAEAAIDAAIAGTGITRVLSYQVAQALRDGALTVALEKFEPAPWPVNLVHAGGRLLPLKLRAFLDFAAPRLKALLSEGGSRDDPSTIR